MNAAPERNNGPGRPKDLEKRAAILAAAKQLFPQLGFDGTSMDAIAAEAGVSKLTVYSHFGGKEALFVETIRCKCDGLLPRTLFNVDVSAPVRDQLLGVARGFFALMMSDGALGMHRTLVASSQQSPKLAKLFWEAGPLRVQAALAELLQKEVAARQLDIGDTRRAASQFFALLKGEHHARMLFGCGQPSDAEVRAHLEATTCSCGRTGPAEAVEKACRPGFVRITADRASEHAGVRADPRPSLARSLWFATALQTCFNDGWKRGCRGRWIAPAEKHPSNLAGACPV